MEATSDFGTSDKPNKAHPPIFGGVLIVTAVVLATILCTIWNLRRVDFDYTFFILQRRAGGRYL